MKNVICIYHSSDLDGICSRDIVKCVFNNSASVNCIGWTYGDLIPEELTDIDVNNTKVVIVDISLDNPTMMRLSTLSREQGLEVVWIDHHITAIEASEALKFSDLNGIRVVGVAACELTFKYFFPLIDVPKAIQLLSAYDVWNKKRFDWDKETLPFQYGMRLYQEIPIKFFINRKKDTEVWIEDVINDGETIIGYNKERMVSVCSNSFEMIIDGYTAICVNSQDFSSNTFESVYNPDMHDLMFNFAIRPSESGNLFIRGSLYSTKDINVSDIAKKLGGGGHKQAAGFELSLADWNHILNGEYNNRGVEFKLK